MSGANPTRSDIPLEIKFVSETGAFEGYASVFGVTDSANDRIAPGAFEKSLARHRAEGRLPPLLWQHDMKEPIGAWREMFEDSHGLFVKGELFVHDIARARSAYKLMRENVVTGLSIGYRTVKSHRDRDSGVRVLTEIELLEVSMVTAPANEQARVMRVKSILTGGGVPSEKDFEAFLREAGMSRRQAKGIMAHGYKSLSLHHAASHPRDADEIDAVRALAETIRALT